MPGGLPDCGPTAFKCSERSCQIEISNQGKVPPRGGSRCGGTEEFTKTHRERCLDRFRTSARRKIIAYFYDQLDATVELRKKACATMVEIGQHYPEIQRFQRVPRIGVTGAHVLSASNHTPHRFVTKQRLWKYGKLRIRERSSADKPLTYECLDCSSSECDHYRSHRNGLQLSGLGAGPQSLPGKL